MNDQPKSSPSPYDAAIADARAKRDILDQVIKVLESMRDGNFMGAFTGPITPVVAHSGAAIETRSTEEVAPGTFHRMSIEAAAKKLLDMRKRALGTREITNSLRAGGLHLQSETPENTVAS